MTAFPTGETLARQMSAAALWQQRHHRGERHVETMDALVKHTKLSHDDVLTLLDDELDEWRDRLEQRGLL